MYDREKVDFTDKEHSRAEKADTAIETILNALDDGFQPLQDLQAIGLSAWAFADIVRTTAAEFKEANGRMPRAEEIGDNLGEVDATVEGEADKIAFNSKYLQDFLTVVGDGRIALEMSGPSRQGVLRPMGDDSYVHVLMPMVVQW